jgi:hypothetical protein
MDPASRSPWGRVFFYRPMMRRDLSLAGAASPASPAIQPAGPLPIHNLWKAKHNAAPTQGLS